MRPSNKKSYINISHLSNSLTIQFKSTKEPKRSRRKNVRKMFKQADLRASEATMRSRITVTNKI